MIRHRWTYEENEVCCRRYLERYVLRSSDLSVSAFVRLLKQELPQLKENSIRRKVHNIRHLSLEAQLNDSMNCPAEENCSSDNRKAFYTLLEEYCLP